MKKALLYWGMVMCNDGWQNDKVMHFCVTHVIENKGKNSRMEREKGDRGQ